MSVNKNTGEVMETDFAAFIATLAEGDTNQELSDTLRTLVKAVKETGKAGSLTYKVDVKPMDVNIGSVAIRDQIKGSIPEFDRPKSLRFYDEDGNLTTEPPNQPSLLDRFLKPVKDDK